jgi:hypothetical protein
MTSTFREDADTSSVPESLEDSVVDRSLVNMWRDFETRSDWPRKLMKGIRMSRRYLQNNLMRTSDLSDVQLVGLALDIRQVD